MSVNLYNVDACVARRGIRSLTVGPTWVREVAAPSSEDNQSCSSAPIRRNIVFYFEGIAWFGAGIRFWMRL